MAVKVKEGAEFKVATCGQVRSTESELELIRSSPHSYMRQQDKNIEEQAMHDASYTGYSSICKTVLTLLAYICY